VKRWFGPAFLSGALALAAPMVLVAAPADAASQKVDAAKTGDPSARSYHGRLDRFGYGTGHTPYPCYCARPYYYRPYPYSSPAPFIFGLGFGPLW